MKKEGVMADETTTSVQLARLTEQVNQLAEQNTALQCKVRRLGTMEILARKAAQPRRCQGVRGREK